MKCDVVMISVCRKDCSSTWTLTPVQHYNKVTVNSWWQSINMELNGNFKKEKPHWRPQEQESELS